MTLDLPYLSFTKWLKSIFKLNEELDLNILKEQLLTAGHTMIGEKRMNSLLQCMEEVEKNRIPGDFIETGVWKGGSTIFMRGFLKKARNTKRKVWVADSFMGFPPTKHPDGNDVNNDIYPDLVISIETVKDNFLKYNLLDEQVCFLKGFFSETLPSAPIKQLAILRLDGDLYDSTMDALTALYPKLSKGGYVIIDDYGFWPGCAEAVHDYRKLHRINEEIFWEDEIGVHWRKEE